MPAVQVRNYIPSYMQVVKGGWNIADCVERAYDVEGMHVGTVAAGRIGLGVLRRLHPFNCKLHYVDRHRCAALPQQPPLGCVACGCLSRMRESLSLSPVCYLGFYCLGVLVCWCAGVLVCWCAGVLVSGCPVVLLSCFPKLTIQLAEATTLHSCFRVPSLQFDLPPRCPRHTFARFLQTAHPPTHKCFSCACREYFRSYACCRV